MLYLCFPNRSFFFSNSKDCYFKGIRTHQGGEKAKIDESGRVREKSSSPLEEIFLVCHKNVKRAFDFEVMLK